MVRYGLLFYGNVLKQFYMQIYKMEATSRSNTGYWILRTQLY